MFIQRPDVLRTHVLLLLHTCPLYCHKESHKLVREALPSCARPTSCFLFKPVSLVRVNLCFPAEKLHGYISMEPGEATCIAHIDFSEGDQFRFVIEFVPSVYRGKANKTDVVRHAKNSSQLKVDRRL